jgi:hypothetical protein
MMRSTINRLKLNPEQSQVILIYRCKVDISPPTLLIGANVVMVVHKVNRVSWVGFE